MLHLTISYLSHTHIPQNWAWYGKESVTEIRQNEPFCRQRVVLTPGCFLQNLTSQSLTQGSVAVVFVTLSLNNSHARDGIVISTSGFSLQIYKVGKNRFYRCRREWLWNTHVTLTNVIALNVIRRRGVYNRVGNFVRAFSTWRTRTGSSNISLCTAYSRTV